MTATRFNQQRRLRVKLAWNVVAGLLPAGAQICASPSPSYFKNTETLSVGNRHFVFLSSSAGKGT